MTFLIMLMFAYASIKRKKKGKKNQCPEHYIAYFEAGNYWLMFMLQFEDL